MQQTTLVIPPSFTLKQKTGPMTSFLKRGLFRLAFDLTCFVCLSAIYSGPQQLPSLGYASLCSVAFLQCSLCVKQPSCSAYLFAQIEKCVVRPDHLSLSKIPASRLLAIPSWAGKVSGCIKTLCITIYMYPREVNKILKTSESEVNLMSFGHLLASANLFGTK